MEVDTCTFVNVLLLIFVIDIPGRRVKNDKCAQSSKVFSASGNMDQWASPAQPKWHGNMEITGSTSLTSHFYISHVTKHHLRATPCHCKFTQKIDMNKHENNTIQSLSSLCKLEEEFSSIAIVFDIFNWWIKWSFYFHHVALPPVIVWEYDPHLDGDWLERGSWRELGPVAGAAILNVSQIANCKTYFYIAWEWNGR